MDKVVESVREEHIVQIVTDNSANFKAGKMLEKKRPHLFWTPCSTLYISHYGSDWKEEENCLSYQGM